MKKLLLSSFLITIFVMGLNFMFKIFLSYKISKDDIGILYTFMDMIFIGIMFFSGFKDSLIRAYDKANFEVIKSWYVVVFWSLFGVILIGEVIYFKSSNFTYPFYTFLSLFFLNALMIFLSYLNASYKNYKIMLFENLVMASGLIGSFFILTLLFNDIYALLFAFLGSFLGRIFYLYLNLPEKLLFKKYKFDNNVKSFLKDTTLSSLMYFFSGIFISASGLVILNLFDDKTVLAEYQVVVKSIFFSLVAIFVFPLNTFTFPQISKLISSKMYGEIKRIEKKLQKYLLLSIAILLMGTLFTKYVIAFVFPSDYAQSYVMLNVLLPFLPLLAYTTFAINIIKAFDRFDLALYVRLVGAILFFVSIYIFYLLQFDASCVVYSLDLSFIGMFLLSYFYKRRLLS